VAIEMAVPPMHIVLLLQVCMALTFCAALWVRLFFASINPNMSVDSGSYFRTEVILEP